jgi:hypothetical protein
MIKWFTKKKKKCLRFLKYFKIILKIIIKVNIREFNFLGYLLFK